MKEKEFRKLVREEIKIMLSEQENSFEVPPKKENIISQIYQWIIRGDMQKAATAMQHDPKLMRLANNVEELKKELISRMSKDEAMAKLIAQSIERLRQKRDSK